MTRLGTCEVTGGPGFIDDEYTSHCLCKSPFSALKCEDYPGWRAEVAPLVGVPEEIAQADREFYEAHMRGEQP